MIGAVKVRLRRTPDPPKRRSDTQGAVDNHWSSMRMLVLAASGAAIGFNNFWQFPALLREQGGAVFLIAYLFCVLVLGLPLLTAELMLGQQGQGAPVGAFRRLARRVRADSNWALVGVLSILAGFLVLSYLSVIAGWTLALTARAAVGQFVGQTADGIASIFGALVRDPEKQLFWFTLFVLSLVPVAGRGVREGLESAVRVAVPLLFVLLGGLLAYAVAIDPSLQSVDQFLVLDFTRFTWRSMLYAMTQAFFSLGLGVGVMMMFGAYAHHEVKVARASVWVVSIDTLVGLIAAFVIGAVLSAGAVEMGAGPRLLFQQLPLAFDHLPFGRAAATVFFLVLVVSAWVSAIAFFEPLVSWFAERRDGSRWRSALGCSGALWVTGLVMMLSFHPWAFSFRFFDSVKKLGMFDIAQILTSQAMMPLAGIFIALFAGWRVRAVQSREFLAFRSPCTFDAWLWLVRLVIPALLVVMMFNLNQLYA